MLPKPEADARSKTVGEALRNGLELSSNDIKTGMLRKRAPEISKKDKETFHARNVGVVLGALENDDCCQVQCLFGLKMGPLKTWTFKEFSSLAEELLGFDDDKDKISALSAKAWLAATLAIDKTELAEQVVKRWAPYKGHKSSEDQHVRCRRDLGHLLSQLLYSVVGLSNIPKMDRWYQQNVLKFIGEKSFEPFAQLVGALEVVLKKELPQPSFEIAEEILRPLSILLKEKS